MATAIRKKSAARTKEFVPMERTRAMLSELWKHWLDTLGHTPDTAKRMMTVAIKEMHKTEVAAIKKTTAKVKSAKKAVAKKPLVKKLKAAKRKIK